MCILFLHTNPHPKPGEYRFIIASNRDEYYTRNAEVAHRWLDAPCIISGLDLEPGREGGTWLGLALSGNNSVRVGALLNKTGEARIAGALGRGSIVTDYLKNIDISTKEYIEHLRNERMQFNAYNFVGLDISTNLAEIVHYSNIDDRLHKYEGTVTLGFGNSSPEAPFSKVLAGQIRFQEIVSSYGQVARQEQLIEELFKFLKWEQKHLPDAELERRAPQAFEYLSSVFVHIPAAGYGTRTHTILLMDWHGQLHYLEHTLQCPINIQDPVWVCNHLKANL